jgi:predicted Fe-S protein YdhL (DUF1289 family)
MATATPARKPLSPCERRCALDAEKTRCITCLRTRNEIVAWGRMSDPERQEVMDQLPARRAAQEEDAS